LLYVAGHATTVAVLGTIAVAFRMALPPATDLWAERLVGLTLLVLGVYVLITFFRPTSHSHGPRTRITLLINGILWLYWRLSLIFGGTRSEARQVFKEGYGSASTFLVGVIHGLGAETFTQVSLFLATATLGGTAGLLGLLMFIVGLVVMNTLMCAVATGIFSAVLAKPHALKAVSLLTSAYSIIVGAIFLLGSAGQLPSLTWLIPAG
jgi:high-affinity nickel-transport protein